MSLDLGSPLGSFSLLGGVNPLSLTSAGSALSGQYDDGALLNGSQGLFGGDSPLSLPSLATFDLLGIGKLSSLAFDWLDRHDIDKYAGFVAGTVAGASFGGDLGGRVGGNLGAIAGDQAGTDLARISRQLWA